MTSSLSVMPAIDTDQHTSPLHDTVAQFSPSLKTFKDTGASLHEFFSPVLNWNPSEEAFPYLNSYKQLITAEVTRLYSADKAAKLAEQLVIHPICETGTHLSLPRDLDGANTAYGFDNTLVFNRLMNSVALSAAAGMKFHLGCRSSHVNITNTNGARYLQAFPDAPLVTLHSNKASDNLVRNAPAIDAATLQQIKALGHKSPYSQAVNDIVYTMSKQQSFPDQIACTQSLQINQCLPDNIEDITIDDSALLEKLMIHSFKDTSSLYHTIFADPALREKFIHDLAGTRSGWRETEHGMQSPFSAVHESKGKKKIQRAMVTDFPHEPAYLASALEEGKIIPTCAMEFSFLLSQTGFLPHGGGFQHQYATEIQTKFGHYLNEIGDHKTADALASLPLNNAVLPQGAGLKADQGLINFSSLLHTPATEEELHNLAKTPVKTLFDISAPDIYNFFNINENKSAGNEPLVMQDTYYTKLSTPSLIIR